MGLWIKSSSYDDKFGSYRRLHYVRFLAYRFCGGEKGFIEFYPSTGGTKSLVYDSEGNKFFMAEPHHDWAKLVAYDKFRNIMWHSDCDGKYTPNGEPKGLDEEDLVTGNTLDLLNELEIIRKEIDELSVAARYKDTFEEFYNIVKGVVEDYKGGRGDGVIKFI